MKKNDALREAVHEQLLEVLAAEDPRLKRASEDTLALAGRLCELARLEASGNIFSGSLQAELDHRARLLMSIADLGIQGKAQRVARAVECFGRCLGAALRAVEQQNYLEGQ